MRARQVSSFERAIPLAVLTLAACAPARTTYLKPSAPGGYHTNSLCAGVVGPKDRLVLADSTGVMVGIETFSLDAVSRALRDSEERENARRKLADRRPATQLIRSGTGISLILHVPSGRLLRFASRSFVFTDQRTSTVHEREPTHVFSHSGHLLDATVVGMVGSADAPVTRPMEIGEPLIGAPAARSRSRLKRSWFGTRVGMPYYVVMELENVKCLDCLLRLPPMIVDSTTVRFPEVRLQQVSEWYVSPLNC